MEETQFKATFQHIKENDYPGSGEGESFKEHLFVENPAFLESVEHTRILDQCIQGVKEDLTTVSALPR